VSVSSEVNIFGQQCGLMRFRAPPCRRAIRNAEAVEPAQVSPAVVIINRPLHRDVPCATGLWS